MKRFSLSNSSQRPKEAGNTLVMVAFFMVALFAFAALSLDVGNVLREQRKAQLGTDAAALAAVALLPAGKDNDLIKEAEVIAAANGVTTKEIADGDCGGYPGKIQVGNWDTNRAVNARFLAGGSPRNAVRVPAQRTVNLWFARVVGLGQMAPVVHSVAMINPGGMVPFGIGSNLLAGVQTGCTDPKDKKCQIEINRQNSGNWGKLDLGGALNNPNVWQDAFANGYDGTLGVGATVDGEPVTLVDTDPGFAKLKDAWNLRADVNPYVVLPVAVQFFNGRKTVTITQFASVLLLNQQGSGNGWRGTVQLIGLSPDPKSFTLGSVRQLVQ